MKKVRKVYQTGSFREVRDVWASDRYRPRGPRLKGNARKSQMDANLKAARRAALRIVNGNFSYRKGDLLCTHNFSDQYLPKSRAEAWELFSKKFLPLLRKLGKKAGKEVKYFAVVSDMDGQTKQDERVHIHVVFSGVTMEQLRECWSFGTVDCRSLRKEKTYARLVNYLLNQCRCEPDEKKWHTSRNLERTRLLSETEIMGNPRYRLPKGAEIIAQGEYCPEEGKLLDLQILMPEPEQRSTTPPPPKGATSPDKGRHRLGGREKTNRKE